MKKLVILTGAGMSAEAESVLLGTVTGYGKNTMLWMYVPLKHGNVIRN